MPAPQNAKDLYPQESYYSVATWPSSTPEERDELAAAITHHLKTEETNKWRRCLQYFQNYAFLAGQHYMHFNFDGSSVTPFFRGGPFKSAIHHVPKTVCNYIIRPYESNASMFTEVKPFPEVAPKSDAPEDEDAAKLSAVVLSVLWEEPLRMPEKLRQLAGQLLLTGTSAVECIFATDESPLLTKRTELKEEEDAVLGTKVLREVEIEGEEDVEFARDFQVNVYNAFHITPDPGATSDPDTMTWIAISTIQDIGWIKETFTRDEEGYYPENLDRITQTNITTNPLYWSERVKDLLDSPHEFWNGMGGMTGGDVLSPNSTIMTVIDAKPTQWFPRGRTLIMAGGQLVYAGQSRAWKEKYPKRWTPLNIFRYWTMPDRFWGIPLITELVPLQKRINAIDALVQLSRQQLVHGGWLLPSTARIPEGSIVPIPGVNITYQTSVQGGPKPERIPNEPLPAQLLVERDTMIACIQELAGMNQVMMGNNPSNVRSGAMLDFLKRQTLQSKSAIFQTFEEGLERLSQNILIEVAENLTEENPELTRRIRVAARDFSDMAVNTFTGADLRDNTIVTLNISSKMMTTPEAQQERARDFLQYGGPAAQFFSPHQMNRLAEALGVEEFVTDTNSDVNRARRNISLIKAGNLMAGEPIPTVDNPFIFAEEFRREIQKGQFRDLEDDIQTKILDLFKAYTDMASQEREAQLMLAQAQAQGGGPAPAPQA